MNSLSWYNGLSNVYFQQKKYALFMKLAILQGVRNIYYIVSHEEMAIEISYKILKMVKFCFFILITGTNITNINF